LDALIATRIPFQDVLGCVELKYNKRPEKIKRINRWRAVLMLALPWPLLILLAYFISFS